MPITVNEGGVLHELTGVTSNEGGTLYDLDTIHANEGGTLQEIFSAWIPPDSKDIKWSGTSGYSSNYTVNENGSVTSAGSSRDSAGGSGAQQTTGTVSSSCYVSATYTLTSRTRVQTVYGGGGGGGPSGSGSCIPDAGTITNELKEPGTYTVRCSAGASATGVSGSHPQFASCSCSCQLTLIFSAP